MNWLSTAGLVFDIAGVIILGSALVTPSGRTLIEQAATYFDASPRLFHALRMQRFDAWFGHGADRRIRRPAGGVGGCGGVNPFGRVDGRGWPAGLRDHMAGRAAVAQPADRVGF